MYLGCLSDRSSSAFDLRQSHSIWKNVRFLIVLCKKFMNPWAWKCSFPEYYKRFNFTDELYWVAVAKSNPTSLNPPPPFLHTWLATTQFLDDYSSSGLSLSNWFNQQMWREKLSKGQKEEWETVQFSLQTSKLLLGWVSSQELQQMPQPKLGEQWERGQKWLECCQTGLDWHWELEGN